MTHTYRNDEARVNVTYAGQNGDLEDTVLVSASDRDLRTWVTEAVRLGSVPGISADPSANFHGHVVDRFWATRHRPYNLIQLRPKTPFG